MSIEIRDRISPELARLAKKVSDRKPVLEAMGQALVSMTKRAFTDESLRPSSWPARKNTHFEERTSKTGKKSKRVIGDETGEEEHNLLRKSGALWQSIRIAKVTNSTVTVGSDRRYAAVQQFGATIRPKNKKFLVFTLGGKKVFAKKVTIPARPFFPFSKAGEMTPVAKQKIEAVVRAKIKAMLPA